ncbi:hypothetical protein A2634_02015 [Candidatus Amesbacteria bacterium RIFCSPHIGHO2_01_FULL_48_32]|uniref:Uncharacterized protein n=1 Tax=Candidatus Amesbacteria bacterium RIFCSPLOWO2_01_FULL_48_25 TaxID=1797259 RepID=A0A1F4ZEQ6_9BACT|nr:MAG: hypothetical protein A2634_02015 [Candidatus Amesbacteria bacterium RIFCSPHIGHO2_01_FULL_48_32]OGD04366.1 MAG: hypothetical protein A2989_05015 [Candidatus Amesbacteria bacterium RIFCSPLOWO2_01_FULL_48_25]HJZ06201.1 hypothetical protein [Patescibacteria group bacterium]
MIKCETCGLSGEGSWLDRLLGVDPDLLEYAAAIKMLKRCGGGTGCGAAMAVCRMRTDINHPEMWIGRGGGDFVPSGVELSNE